MKAWWLRGFFILVVLTSLIIRNHSIDSRNRIAESIDISTSISNLLIDEGLTLLDNPVKPPRVLSDVVYFKRPECPSESLVMPFRLRMDAMAKLRRLDRPDYVHRIFYLDKNWETQNRIDLFLLWIKHSLQAVVSNSDYLPVRQAIVLAESPTCAGSDDIDWRVVWQEADSSKNIVSQRTSVISVN